MNNTTAKTPSNRLSRSARVMAGLGLVVGILALLGMLLSGPFYRFGVLDLKPAFGLMALAAKAGLTAVIIAVIGLLLALFAQRGRYAIWALIGIVLGLLAFVPPSVFKHRAGQVPPIHDISTDTANPPPFEAVLKQRANAPNSAVYGGARVAAQQHQAYPDIKPLTFKAAPDTVFTAALKTAKSMGWKIDAQTPSRGRIEATATTFWYGFKDDVVIRITPEADGTTRLDIRSASRVGRSDVGKNAARIRTFSKKLSNRLGTG